MDQADLAIDLAGSETPATVLGGSQNRQDGKREGSTCAKGLCTAPPSRDTEELVDYLAEHGHLPNLARSTTSPQSCEAEGRTDGDHSEGWCQE